jgi:hypothetical protein
MTLKKRKSRLSGFLFALGLGLGIIVIVDACVPRGNSAAAQSSMQQRIQEKAARAQKEIQARAQAGQDVSKYLTGMAQAKKHFDAGEPLKGEEVIDGVLSALESDSAGAATAPRAGATAAAGQMSVQEKAQKAQSLIMQRAQNGEQVRPYLDKMKEAKAHFDDGDMAGGEAILDEVLADLNDAPVNRTPPLSATDSTGGYGEPERVKIEGYDSEKGAMEPFISRDGKTLLFNNATDAFGAGTADADLQYARRNSNGVFEYVGRVKGANSKKMDGAASLDDNNTLFFTSVRSYDSDRKTLYTGKFEDGMAENVKGIPGDISRNKRGELNMDGEITADGKELYFSDNTWDTTYNIPKSSNLVIAKRTNSGEFLRSSDSDRIMKNINTDDLEYAPATTADELTLYFTRARFHKAGGKLAGVETGIYMATRKSKDAPFDPPVRLSTISGFVEGPTVTADGNELYFHRKDGNIYHLYRVVR